MAIRIKRGDACGLEISLCLGGDAVPAAEVETAEFMLGETRKLYPGEVSYDSALEAYVLPISQEESFALPEGGTTLDIRVKFLDGSVSGLASPIPVSVAKSVSEAVL